MTTKLTKVQRAVLEAMRRKVMGFDAQCGRRHRYWIAGHGAVRVDVVATLERAGYIRQITDNVFRGQYAITYEGRWALDGQGGRTMKYWFVVFIEKNKQNGKWYPDNFVTTEHPVLWASTREEFEVYLLFFTEIEQDVAEAWMRERE